MKQQTGREARRRREWRRRHGELLAAAADLFGENGFDSVTMQEVADRAGFSVGYLYKHFESRQALIDALYEQEFDQYERIIAEVDAEPGLGPLERYVRRLRGLCAQLEQRRSLIAVLVQKEPQASAEVRCRERGFRADTERLLHEAVAAGEIPPVEVHFLAALLDGVLWEFCKEIAAHRPDSSLHQVPDLMLEFVMDPLRSGRPLPTGKEPETS